MDTHEDLYWIHHTRLRSERHKKRKQREDADKQLIRKHKEELAIWLAVRQLGWTELKPPVQRGFIRFFVLRPDVARTKEAPFFQKILDKINSTQLSHRKDFKKKRRRFGKKVYVVREQQLTDMSEYDFAKKFIDKEKGYFYEVLVHYEKSKIPAKVYRFLEPWRFVLKVQPNMITKVRVKDLDLEKQRDALNRFFNFERRLRLSKLLYGRDTWRWSSLPKGKYDNPFRNKPIASILDEHWPDQPMRLAYKNPRETEGFSFMYSSIKYRIPLGAIRCSKLDYIHRNLVSLAFVSVLHRQIEQLWLVKTTIVVNLREFGLNFLVETDAPLGQNL